MSVHHKTSAVSLLCSFLCVFFPISVHGKNEGICERVGWQECKTTSSSRNQRCHILSPHMPSSLLLLLLFWCIFCTVKENRCWFGNPFALFLCLLIGGSTHCFGHVALDRSLAAYPCASHDGGRWWWWTCTPSVWWLTFRNVLILQRRLQCDGDDDGELYERCRWVQQSSRAPSVEDDEEGHLIYRTGDILQDRCSWINISLC